MRRTTFPVDAAAQPLAGRRHGFIAWLILAAGLAISTVAASFAHRHLQQEAALRFEGDTRELQRRIEEQVGAYEEVLIGLRALFHSRANVTRAEFAGYVASLDLDHRYPGFSNLNYAEYVTEDQVERFRAKVRRELHDSGIDTNLFRIKPALSPELNVIVYIEPWDINSAYLGVNMNANNRSHAMNRIRDTGRIMTSGTLIQGGHLAMRLATYRPGMPLDSAEERRRAFTGSVGAGFRVLDMMRGAVDFERFGHIRYRLYDRGPDTAAPPQDATAQDSLLFDSRDLAPAAIAALHDRAEGQEQLRRRISFPIGGRNWEVRFTTPLQLSATERATPLLVLLAGVLGSALLFHLYRQLTGSKHRAEANLNHLAMHDALTGLPNRLLLADRLTGAIARAERAGRGLAVLLVDLDRFKNVNDTLGHGAGDAVLKACGERIRRTLYDTDFIAHISGDEFAVLLDPCPQPAAAIAVARKVLQAIERPLIVQGQEIVLTGSIGIAKYHEDGRDPETVLKHADVAMFRAKEHGRNNYQFYTPQMNPHSLQRLNLESALRRALERKEFALHYQPKLDLRTGEVTGVEALLRWNQAELGMVSPVQFIPIAEETGLIEPIGAWVLREACRQARQWQDLGLEGVRVAVNLSARQFRNQRLARDIERILRETGADPRLLELELTESMVMHDPEKAVAMLNELKSMGLTLSIDDFGTGYSSLAYLKRFPIDSVKVDRSFVKDIPGNSEDVAIVESVIALAHSLRLRVVAEGVETAEQKLHLGKAGCDEMQGYLASKPVPPDEATRFLERSKRKEARDRLTRPSLSIVS